MFAIVVRQFQNMKFIPIHFLVLALISQSVLAAETPAKTRAPKTATAKAAPEKAAETSAATFNASGTGNVEFLALGRPAMIKILGKSDGPKGDLKAEKGALSGKLILDLNNFDTGIKLRNEHTKDKYLEVGKFPQAELTLDPLTLAELEGGKDFSKEKVPFKGTLKLHGEEKPVSGEADISRKGKELAVKAEFSIKTVDFKIETPKYMGITVAEDVKVNTNFSAVSKN